MNVSNRLISLVSTALVGLGTLVVATGGCSVNYITSSGSSVNNNASGRSLSDFLPIQVDPPSEDSAGPQFAVAADLNGDGLNDLVSAWNQSQPVQIHLQGRDADGDATFETVTLAGNVPAVSVAGLEVADFNLDERPDIAVLIKVSLEPDAGCLGSDLPPEGTLSGLVLLYLGPENAQVNQALAWQEIAVESSRLPAPTEDLTIPEVDGFTSMQVGDIDLDGDVDIVVASNISCAGQASDVLLFTNQGPGAIQDGTWQGQRLPNPFPRNTIKDIELGDVDGDGDLDIVATFPDAPSMNVRWFRNPVIDSPDDYHLSDGAWHVGAIAQIASGADVIDLGDIDRDGNLDVVVRSTNGRLIQWLQGPGEPTTEPVRSIPWRVYTVAEFTERNPEALAVVDINGDGQLEITATAQGGLVWFDPLASGSIFDQWAENLILDDSPPEADTAVQTVTDPTVDAEEVVPEFTLMNSIFPVDLDGDGSEDLIVPLDRSGLSGLTNDALIWFRNLRN